MKHSNRNKLLGTGIFLGLLIVFFIFNPFRSTINQPSKVSPETSATAPGSTTTGAATKTTSREPNAINGESTQKKEAKESTVSPGQPPEKASPENASKEVRVPSSTATLTPPGLVGGAPATGLNVPAGGATTTGLKVPAAGAPTGSNARVAKEESSNQAKSQKVVSVPLDGCFNLTFVHKKIASHEDGEACLLHKNLIVLNHPDQNKQSKIDPKSVCMRINGKAVKYSAVPGKPDQVILGPEAGPNAKITASYCVGKAKCPQSCVPEKDQFLSAIGADEESDHAGTVGWDGKKGKSQEDTEVENQMTALNSDLSATGGENSQIFDGWILETQTAKCEQVHSPKTIAQVKAE